LVAPHLPDAQPGGNSLPHLLPYGRRQGRDELFERVAAACALAQIDLRLRRGPFHCRNLDASLTFWQTASK
jgi:hypothetical protein